MSYIAIEEGLANVLSLHPDFSRDLPRRTGNIGLGDFRVLGRTYTSAVVLMPGAVPIRDVAQAPRRVRTVWTVLIHLFTMFREDQPSISLHLKEDREKILDHVDQYPTLNGVDGVVSAIINRVRQPAVWQGENKNWWLQIMDMTIESRKTVTIKE